MPRIGDQFADCVVYIYGSPSDAKAGERQGGSGFLVTLNYEKNPDWCEVYVITNQHNIRKARMPVVRINRKDGKTEYFETNADHWFTHPDGTDVAAWPLNTSLIEQLKIAWVALDLFITPELIQKHDVGIGDDTFMLGRFMNHEGVQKNTPAIRFGNISMMPGERIIADVGLAQDSFLIETRSLPGYSGSPVFLFSTQAGSDFSNRDLKEEEQQKKEDFEKRLGRPLIIDMSKSIVRMRPKGPFLLGIDWCHIKTEEKVRDSEGNPISEKWIVYSNSGMAGVIPAWKIRELLYSEELIEMRRLGDEQITLRKRESGAVLD